VIHRINFRAFVAATEDEARVREALAIFVPLDSITATKVAGHHGNEIVILEAMLGRRDGSHLFEILREQLTPQDLSRLQREIPERTDEDCCFHMRLDKQAAFKGRIALTDSKDAIDACAHIATYPSKRDEAVRILGELL